MKVMKISQSSYMQIMAPFCAELPLILHNAHMALGVEDEMDELMKAIQADDRTNIKEELGDMAWFLSQYCRVNNLSFWLILSDTRSNLKEIHELSKSPSYMSLTTLTKKEIAYGYQPTLHERNNAVAVKLQEFIETTKDNGFTIDEVLQTNYDKLSARYPDKGFNRDNALNRNLDAERVVLEA